MSDTVIKVVDEDLLFVLLIVAIYENQYFDRLKAG